MILADHAEHPDRQPLYIGPYSLQECHADETGVQGPIQPEHRQHQAMEQDS